MRGCLSYQHQSIRIQFNPRVYVSRHISGDSELRVPGCIYFRTKCTIIHIFLSGSGPFCWVSANETGSDRMGLDSFRVSPEPGIPPKAGIPVPYAVSMASVFGRFPHWIEKLDHSIHGRR